MGVPLKRVQTCGVKALKEGMRWGKGFLFFSSYIVRKLFVSGLFVFFDMFSSLL